MERTDKNYAQKKSHETSGKKSVELVIKHKEKNTFDVQINKLIIKTNKIIQKINKVIIKINKILTKINTK